MVQADCSGSESDGPAQGTVPLEEEGMGMVTGDEDRRRTFVEAVQECNRIWLKQFNLERTMDDQAKGGFDCDDLLAFVEIVTRDKDALAVLGSGWDARRLMLFLVNLANQSLPEGAYMLSKLYARGIYVSNEEGAPKPLVSKNTIKAAVWTQVAFNITQKSRGGPDQRLLAYYERKL